MNIHPQPPKPKKKKSRVQKKAPGAPKRGKSPYILFSMHIREEVKQTLPTGAKVTDIVRAIARCWSVQTEEQRRPWLAAAAVDRQRYEEEMATYDGPLRVSKQHHHRKSKPAAGAPPTVTQRSNPTVRPLTPPPPSMTPTAAAGGYYLATGYPEAPLTAFGSFRTRLRHRWTLEFPEAMARHAASPELSSTLEHYIAQLWHEQTPVEKEVYEGQSAVDQLRYSRELRDWNLMQVVSPSRGGGSSSSSILPPLPISSSSNAAANLPPMMDSAGLDTFLSSFTYNNSGHAGDHSTTPGNTNQPMYTSQSYHHVNPNAMDQPTYIPYPVSGTPAQDQHLAYSYAQYS